MRDKLLISKVMEYYLGKENTLYFIKKSEDNEIKKIAIPIEKVFAIFCYGRVTLSSGSIYILSKYNIPVRFF